MKNKQKFREWLRERMTARGMTDADLASKMNVCVSSVQNWRTGKLKPHTGNRIRLEKILSDQ